MSKRLGHDVSRPIERNTETLTIPSLKFYAAIKNPCCGMLHVGPQ